MIGVGGGILNDATSRLPLSDTSITLNQAAGVAGIGGGVYVLGTFTYDVTTIINHNKARSLDNNIAPGSVGGSADRPDPRAGRLRAVDVPSFQLFPQLPALSGCSGSSLRRRVQRLLRFRLVAGIGQRAGELDGDLVGFLRFERQRGAVFVERIRVLLFADAERVGEQDVAVGS